MLEKLKDQVADVLKTDPDSRNSDITLTIQIWKQFYPKLLTKDPTGILYAPLKNLYELPREDNIKRIRAKFQEEALKRIETGKLLGDEEYYLPSDPKIAEKRGILAAIWQKAMGYFKARLPQTEQLPRPVGMLGFSFIKSDFEGEHYEADGAGSKKHKVRRSGQYWYCDCESYRYAGKVKTCKHIHAIQDYLKKRETAEAAAHQPTIF